MVAEEFSEQSIPKLKTRVTDEVGLLSDYEVNDLTSTLAGIEKEYGVQAAILIVSTTEPEEIEKNPRSYTGEILKPFFKGKEKCLAQ